LVGQKGATRENPVQFIIYIRWSSFWEKPVICQYSGFWTFNELGVL